MTERERFLAKIDHSHPDGCWEWIAGILPHGYGTFAVGVGGGAWKKVLAHRYSYELLIGPIPPGLQLDHLCRNRACVNPAHLEPVTQAENIRRGENWNRNKASCQNGHAFSRVNTRIERRPGGLVARRCLACQREYDAERAHRMKVAA